MSRAATKAATVVDEDKKSLDDVDLEYMSNISKQRRDNTPIFCFFAFTASVAVLWSHVGIRKLDLSANAPFYIVGSICSFVSLLYVFRGMDNFLKFRIAQRKRLHQLDTSSFGENSKELKKQQRKLIQKYQIVDKEACFLSICLYNSMFITASILCTFLLFTKMHPILNYLLSIVIASLAVLVHSKSTT